MSAALFESEAVDQQKDAGARYPIGSFRAARAHVLELETKTTAIQRTHVECEGDVRNVDSAGPAKPKPNMVLHTRGAASHLCPAGLFSVAAFVLDPSRQEVVAHQRRERS